MATHLRTSLIAALAKPLPDDDGNSDDEFDPWVDIVHGILGGYSAACDDLMIRALEAVRDQTTFEFIESDGLAAEMALYILAGHGLTDYGTSPRGAWPDHEIEDLWQHVIDK